MSPRSRTAPPHRHLRTVRMGLAGAFTILLLGLAILAALSSSVLALELRSATDPTMRWGYLSNGLRYAIIENHAAPMVGSVAIVHGGSGAEDWSSQGASHFLEHALFNGTTSRTQEQIYAEIDLLGAYNNATTRGSHVAFLLVAPKRTFWQALDVQQDMLFHSTLPPEKLEKERGIILEELSGTKEDRSYEASRILDLDLFGPSGYGLPTLGTATSIKTLTRDQINRFYKDFYQPNNVTWLLIGDLEARAAAESLEVMLGGVPAGATPPAVLPPAVPGPPLTRIHRAGVSSPSIRCQWLIEDNNALQDQTLSARTQVVLEGDDSPLALALKQALGSALLSYSGFLTFYPGRSVCSLDLEMAAEGDVQAALNRLPEVLERVMAVGVEPARLEAWKTAHETEELYLREKPHYYGIYRGDFIAAFGLAGLAGYLPAIAALTAESVSALPPPLTWPPDRISVLLPERGEALAGGETPPSPPAMRPGGMAGKAAPAAGPLPTADPTSRAEDRWTLSNGVQVYALSGADSPVLAAHLFVRERSAREPAGQSGMAELLHNLLGRSTTGRTPEALAMDLRKIGAELKTADLADIPYDDFYSVPEFSYVRFQTLDRFAPEGLQLLAQIVGRPDFTAEDFDHARAAALRRATRASQSSRAVAGRMRQQILHPGAGEVFGTPASLAGVTEAELRTFAATYLDPRSFLVVIASSLPLDDLRNLTEATLGQISVPSTPAPVTALAGWSDQDTADSPGSSAPDPAALALREQPGRGPAEDAAGSSAGKGPPRDGTTLAAVLTELRADPGQARARRLAGWDRTAAARGSAAPDGRLAFAADSIGAQQGFVELDRVLLVPDSLRPVLTVANGVLSERLAQELRERQGLAYSIGSSVVPATPGTWIWSAAAASSAESFPRLLEGFEGAADELLATPPDSLEIARTAARIYGRGLMRRATRLNWAWYAGQALLQGDDPRLLERRQAELAEVTPSQVNDLVRRYWPDAPGLVIAVR